MTRHMIATMILGLTSLGGVAQGAQFLAPCANAEYLAAPIKPEVNGEAAELNFVQVPANSLGCKRGVVRRVDATTTIWRCPVELADGEEFKAGQPQGAFLIKTGNRPLQELPDEVMAGAFDNFDVVNVNLNYSNQRHHILAAWNGQSNGMGVHSWTIHIFDENWHFIRRFDEVVDWGPSNIVARLRNRRGCDIAITSFENPTPSSNALFLRANFYRAGGVSAGIRVPSVIIEVAGDRPRLERRYNRAFQTQRTAWFSRGDWQWRGDIATWLNNPATNVLPLSRR